MNIVFFGDSITDCGRCRETKEPNVYLGDGYVSLLSSSLLYHHPELDLKIYNRGVSGNKVTDGLARLDEDLLSLKPDIVNILFGINGVWHKYTHGTGITDEQFETSYRAILDKIFKNNPKVKIILTEPYALYFDKAKIEWKSEVDQRIKIVNKIAKDYSLPIIHLQEKFNKEVSRINKTQLLLDGVHPALAGHYMIAKLWLDEFFKLK